VDGPNAQIALKTCGPPHLQGVLSRSAADQSASTYPASEVSSRPRWRFARPVLIKLLGVVRRFQHQASCETALGEGREEALAGVEPGGRGATVVFLTIWHCRAFIVVILCGDFVSPMRARGAEKSRLVVAAIAAAAATRASGAQICASISGRTVASVRPS
jgi:hypothetical protein